MAELKNHPGKWLRDDAAAAFDKAEDDHGKFVVNSAGRTVAEQQRLIDRWNQGGTYNRPPYLYRPANPPQNSNHVSNGGIAIDIGDWRRFSAICRDYGFEHPYPGGDPVHFEFTGSKAPSRNQTTADRQSWLNSRGWSLVVDGIEGPLTKQAYKEYQSFLRDYGYKGAIDGIWGNGTQAAHHIYWTEVNRPKPTPPSGLLRRGSRGSAVSRLQARLNRDYPLYSNLVVDGIFGAATEKVVREFQRRSGITVDGIAGPVTLSRLGL